MVVVVTVIKVGWVGMNVNLMRGHVSLRKERKTNSPNDSLLSLGPYYACCHMFVVCGGK